MDAVYLVAPSTWDQELRYSLRSLARHFPALGRVWIVGHLPDYVDPARVQHVPEPPMPRPGVFVESAAKRWLNAELDLSDDYVMVQDDNYVLRDVQPSDFGPFAMQDLDTSVQRGTNPWQNMLWRTHDLLKVLGAPVVNYEAHAPVRVNRARFAQMADRFAAIDAAAQHRYQSYCTITAYWNLCGVPDGEGFVADQVRTGFTHPDQARTVAQIEATLADKTFAFHNDGGLTPALMEALARRFPNPSPFERRPPSWSGWTAPSPAPVTPLASPGVGELLAGLPLDADARVVAVGTGMDAAMHHVAARCPTATFTLLGDPAPTWVPGWRITHTDVDAAALAPADLVWFDGHAPDLRTQLQAVQRAHPDAILAGTGWGTEHTTAALIPLLAEHGLPVDANDDAWAILPPSAPESAHAAYVPPPPSLRQGLAHLDQRWPDAAPGSTDNPVFVFSAGWRSGSTLLQRLLQSECWMWGEPYCHSAWLNSLPDMFRAMTPKWPKPHHLHQPGDPHDRHTANVATHGPPLSELHAAHLAFFDRLFRVPAHAEGVDRWGIKFVRYTADHAWYLRWLFPHATFLFLHRHPLDAYRSWRARHDAGWRWYRRWPDQPLTTQSFAAHWANTAGSFVQDADAIGGLLVPYADLQARRFGAIQDHVGFALSDRAADAVPSDGGPPPIPEIPAHDLAVLLREVGPVAAALGYALPEPLSS